MELQRWMPWACDPSMAPTIKYIKDGISSWRSEAQRDFPMTVIHKGSGEIIGNSGYIAKSNPAPLLFSNLNGHKFLL